jgi:hypothetical protein
MINNEGGRGHVLGLGSRVDVGEQRSLKAEIAHRGPRVHHGVFVTLMYIFFSARNFVRNPMP